MKGTSTFCKIKYKPNTIIIIIFSTKHTWRVTR